MPLRTLPAVLRAILLFLFASTQASPLPGLAPDGNLDEPRIHALYLDGEFDQVVVALETFRKTRKKLSDSEQVIVYKYLGVIYAADPATRKRAESFFVSLLRQVPTIQLTDMYVSESIENWFEELRQRQLQQAQYLQTHDRYGRPLKAESETPAGREMTTSAPPRIAPRTYWLAAAAVGLGAATTLTYWMVSEEPERQAKTPITLPE